MINTENDSSNKIFNNNYLNSNELIKGTKSNDVWADSRWYWFGYWRLNLSAYARRTLYNYTVNDWIKLTLSAIGASGNAAKIVKIKFQYFGFYPPWVQITIIVAILIFICVMIYNSIMFINGFNFFKTLSYSDGAYFGIYAILITNYGKR